MNPKPFPFQDLGPGINHAGGFVPFVQEEASPEKRTYKAQDMALAEQRGFERGYQEGLAAGIAQTQSQDAETNRNIAASLQSLDGKLDNFFKTFNATLKQSHHETTSLALAIARKVAGDALEANSASRIEALAQQCAGALFARSDVTITLHPDMLEEIRTRLDALAEQHHFKGNIHYTTDAAMPVQDCTITWQDGGAQLDTPGTWQKIEAILIGQGLKPAVPHTTETQTTPPAEGEQHG